MLFKQLIETDSSTYTYLIACEDTRKAILIDPVLDTVERDLQIVKDLELKLIATLETHVHADHLTGSRRLQQRSGCNIACPAMLQLPCADLGVKEGEAFSVGTIELHPLFTPGHTDHHHAYLIDTPIQKMLFTGDALLIDGCGRTDFQSGNAGDLYNSIHNKFFSLPDTTLVYPAHDYEGRFVSSIAQEKARNPRLGQGRSKEDFVALMEGLDLPYPAKNRFCGTAAMRPVVNAPKMCPKSSEVPARPVTRGDSMLGKVWKWFLQGIALIAPVALTIALLVWLGTWSENTFGGLIRSLLPDSWYFKGLGLLSGIAVTLAVGLAANLFLVRWVVCLVESILERIPLVTSLFQAFKDVARLFSQDADQRLGQVVAVDIGTMRLVGFVMQKDAHLPGGCDEEDEPRVAVYLAMSYQLGGFTVHVPEKQHHTAGCSGRSGDACGAYRRIPAVRPIETYGSC